jgi:hypothetical protein
MHSEGSPGTWEALTSPHFIRVSVTASEGTTLADGKDGGESEHLIVPSKPGKPPKRPGGGKGVPEHVIVWSR